MNVIKKCLAKRRLEHNQRVQRKMSANLSTFSAMVDTEIDLGTRIVERDGDRVLAAIKPTSVIVSDWFDRRLFIPKSINDKSGARDLFVAWLYKLKLPQALMLYLLASAFVARSLVEAGFFGMQHIFLATSAVMLILTTLHLTGLLFPREAEVPEDYDWLIPHMMQRAKRYALLGEKAVYVSSPSTKSVKDQNSHDRETRLRVIPYSGIGRIELVLRAERQSGDDQDINVQDYVVYDKTGHELFRIDRKNASSDDEAMHLLKGKLADVKGMHYDRNGRAKHRLTAGKVVR